jgi:tetratricopeptide (TPR) repeat protein
MDRLQQLNDFLKQRPDDPFILYALASEYRKLENLDQARSYYEKLISEHPDYVGTYYHYAKLKWESGLEQEALELARKGKSVSLQQGDQHAASELQGLILDWEDLLEEE